MLWPLQWIWVRDSWLSDRTQKTFLKRQCGKTTPPQWIALVTVRRRPTDSCRGEARGRGGRRGGARTKRRKRTWRAPVRWKKNAGRAKTEEEAAPGAAAARPAVAQRAHLTTCRRSAWWPTSASAKGRSPSTRHSRRYVRSFPPCRRTNSARSRPWSWQRGTSTSFAKFYKATSWTREGPAATTWRTSAWAMRSQSGGWGARGPCRLRPTRRAALGGTVR